MFQKGGWEGGVRDEVYGHLSFFLSLKALVMSKAGVEGCLLYTIICSFLNRFKTYLDICIYIFIYFLIPLYILFPSVSPF